MTSYRSSPTLETKEPAEGRGGTFPYLPSRLFWFGRISWSPILSDIDVYCDANEQKSNCYRNALAM